MAAGGGRLSGGESDLGLRKSGCGGRDRVDPPGGGNGVGSGAERSGRSRSEWYRRGVR